MFQYLKGGCKEVGDYLFTWSHMEKMRGSGHRLLLGRKTNFHNENNHWNNLPREVVDSLAWDTFKSQPDRMLGPCLDCAFARKGWTR